MFWWTQWSADDQTISTKDYLQLCLADLTTATAHTGVYLKVAYEDCSVCKMHYTCTELSTLAHVKESIRIKTATLIYKHLDSGLPQYFHEYINYNTSSVNMYTRHVVATKKYLDVPVLTLLFTSPRIILINPLLMMDPGYTTVSHWLYNLPQHCDLLGKILRLICLMKRILRSIFSSGCTNTFWSRLFLVHGLNNILFTLRIYCALKFDLDQD